MMDWEDPELPEVDGDEECDEEEMPDKEELAGEMRSLRDLLLSTGADPALLERYSETVWELARLDTVEEIRAWQMDDGNEDDFPEPWEKRA